MVIGVSKSSLKRSHPLVIRAIKQVSLFKIFYINRIIAGRFCERAENHNREC